MKWLTLALSLCATTAFADYNMNGKTIECYCTDTSGGRVELGDSICLFVDGRSFMAQCQMSLNVPMWREVAPSCLSSDLQSSPRQSRQPSIDTFSIDTKI